MFQKGEEVAIGFHIQFVVGNDAVKWGLSSFWYWEMIWDVCCNIAADFEKYGTYTVIMCSW